MMFFTGFSRFAIDFAQDQIKNMNSRMNQLRMIRSLVDSAADILLNPKTRLRELGELMHQSRQIKRELAASVSNSQIDKIYEAGRDAGAVGGELLGAGGDGFMVLLIDVKPDGSFSLDQSYFNYCTGLNMTNTRFHALFGGKPRGEHDPLTQRDMDLATSIQAVTDDVVSRLTRSIARETGSKQIVPRWRRRAQLCRKWQDCSRW